VSYKLPREIIAALEYEMTNAKTKFPSNKHLTVALMEEVGELAQAQLQGLDKQRIVNEAIQVATTAIRIIEDGDADLEEIILPTIPSAPVRLVPDALKSLFAATAPKIRYSRSSEAVQASIVIEGFTYHASIGAAPLEEIDEASICRALWDEVRTKYYA
jgi:hypothetical protein